MTPILLEPPLRRDKFEDSQFFDALNDGTPMDAGDAGNGGLPMGVVKAPVCNWLPQACTA
jgi:hypothetical protein